MKAQEEMRGMRSMHKVLSQAGRAGYVRTPEQCVSILNDILPHCGEFSHSRKMCQAIGVWLLRGGTEILTPVCPDYSHQDGKYDFHTLNGGVPLLGELHIRFLRGVVQHIPGASVTFVVADHEADDPLLCRVVRKSREEFIELVHRSVVELQKVVELHGWRAEVMTKVIPTLVEEEARSARWIENDPSLRGRINSETAQRSEMYWRIDRSMRHSEMTTRTIRTAAQYVALGIHARKNGLLVCNHTTTNLSWYPYAEAAVLHNPIEVY